MGDKIIDFFVFKLEKKIRDNGFSIKKDSNKQIKVLFKLGGEEKVSNS